MRESRHSFNSFRAPVSGLVYMRVGSSMGGVCLSWFGLLVVVVG